MYQIYVKFNGKSWWNHGSPNSDFLKALELYNFRISLNYFSQVSYRLVYESDELCTILLDNRLEPMQFEQPKD